VLVTHVPHACVPLRSAADGPVLVSRPHLTGPEAALKGPQVCARYLATELNAFLHLVQDMKGLRMVFEGTAPVGEDLRLLWATHCTGFLLFSCRPVIPR
jgi:hypothetical protein